MARELGPMSETRRKEAERIARGHPEVERVLAAGGRIVMVAPNFTDRDEPEGENQAIVGVVDYASGRSLVATVDPARKEVLALEEAAAQLQLSDDERQDAERLAAADPRVRRFLRRRALNPLTRLYFPPRGTPGHRYAIVFVRPTRSARRYAVVDLTTDEVVDVLGPDALVR